MIAALSLSATAAAAASYTGPTSYSSTGTCSVTDISATADACYARFAGVNDDNGFKLNSNDNKANFNVDKFNGVTGLFGKTAWSFLGKDEGGAPVSSTFSPNFNGIYDGTWASSVNLGLFEYVAIILKQSNGFAAYFYDGNAPSSGLWATTAAVFGNTANAISHISVYVGPRGTTPPPAPIPLPAGGILLLSGLGLIAVMRRKVSALVA